MNAETDPELKPFPIPRGSTVMETLELGLEIIETLVDRAWSYGQSDEPGYFKAVVTKTLTEKVEDLFPDGYGFAEDDYDRYFWPEVVGLDELRQQITEETAIALADQWLLQSGNLKGMTPAIMASYPEAGALRTEMLMRTMVGSLCIYIEGWVEGLFEQE